MPAPEFPRSLLGQLQEHAVRLIDSRKPGTENASVGRELLAGFYDVCTRSGLDGLLAALIAANPELDVSERSAFADDPKLLAALVTQLGTINIDDGSPRAAKPGKLVDCVLAAAGVTVVDERDRSIAVDGAVRAAAAAAIASVIDTELALPRLRDAIIAYGREHCEQRYQIPYDKLTAQLDERGMKIVKQLKLPVDAVHAVERILFDARNAVIGRAAHTAIDRAKDLIAKASPEAAARIDQPITLRLTPREVAIARACDPRLPKLPAVVATTLFDSVTELARIAWRAPEQKVRPYAASQTFAVGELIEHPKFGRGSVISRHAARIEVEFPDGKHTLVHAPPK